MSHNDDKAERSARRHRPAIIAIAVALLVAVLAYLVFMPGTDEQGEGIATTPPPADTPLTDAEGTAGAEVPADTDETPAEPAEGDSAPASN